MFLTPEILLNLILPGLKQFEKENQNYRFLKCSTNRKEINKLFVVLFFIKGLIEVFEFRAINYKQSKSGKDILMKPPHG